jgi:D-arabinose 1-dehydrogenase-like Zn-dependent alcohol dehydrogenase
MGYTVVAISRGTAKKELAMELGAHHYIGKLTSTDNQYHTYLMCNGCFHG